MHSWSTFGTWMNHKQTQTHKIHHGLNLREATTYPLIVLFVPRNRPYTQMSFCPETPKLGVPKFSKWGVPQLWRPIIFCANLWLRWGLKQSCSLCQKLSNYMQHITYTQVNKGDSQLLMVGSQIGNLFRNPSFSHNLCFKYPNGSCEPILDIYISRSFQWYKELFNLMSFDPYNFPLKI